MTDSDSAFVIECQLLRWSDNHIGRTVTLQLPHEGEHPFRGLKCGPANGERLAISVVRISDDETQTAMEAQATRPPKDDPVQTSPAGGEHKAGNKSWFELSPAQQTGIYCGDPAFVLFLREQHRGVFDSTEPKWSHRDRAAECVRIICGVKSRADIQPESIAAGRWQVLSADFRAWKIEPSVVPERQGEKV